MRLVVTETGMTFSRWRQQLQIIVAIQKLSAGDTVQSVSGALGYESVSAFITMFKKALGKSPARYFSDRGADLTRHLRVHLAGGVLPTSPDAWGL